MVDKPQSKKSSKSISRGKSKIITWVLVAFSLIILITSACSVWQNITNSVEFALVDGDENLLVLLRNEEQGEYTVQYNGNRPVEIEDLLVMLAPETLHVSVTEVVLIRGDEEVVLEKASEVPDGTQFLLQPGDIFDIRVTFLGRTIGGNWLYGFRINYDDGGGIETTELVLGFEYAIVVR